MAAQLCPIIHNESAASYIQSLLYDHIRPWSSISSGNISHTVTDRYGTILDHFSTHQLIPHALSSQDPPQVMRRLIPPQSLRHYQLVDPRRQSLDAAILGRHRSDPSRPLQVPSKAPALLHLPAARVTPAKDTYNSYNLESKQDMSGRILKKCVIACSGDFGKSRSHDNCKRWIEHAGGRMVVGIDERITHLVCSKEHFKKSTAMVVKAKKFKKVHIVSFDWLEDSLQGRGRKDEIPYLHCQLQRSAAKVKRSVARQRQQNLKDGISKFEKHTAEFKREMGHEGYSPYRDHTGFQYIAILVRADLTNNVNERYFVKIFETHELPHRYCCYVTYSSPRQGTAKEVLAPIGSSFELAFHHFKRFFKLRTRIDWDQRKERPSSEIADAFTYAAPGADKPQGMGVENAVASAAER